MAEGENELRLSDFRVYNTTVAMETTRSYVKMPRRNSHIYRNLLLITLPFYIFSSVLISLRPVFIPIKES